MNSHFSRHRGPSKRCPACERSLDLNPATPPEEAACPYCGQEIWFPPLPTIATFDFIVREASFCRLDAGSMEEAIGTLVDSLAKAGHVPEESAADVTAAFIRREQLGSTAIGGGYAVPHVKHPAISALVGAVGYAPDGIDFRAVDGELVNIVILLMSPPNQPGDHLRALERISRFFRGQLD
jgi:mannitol/fructose-specific phosphotransferase system IIA component (Ntr-type)